MEKCSLNRSFVSNFDALARVEDESLLKVEEAQKAGLMPDTSTKFTNTLVLGRISAAAGTTFLEEIKMFETRKENVIRWTNRYPNLSAAGNNYITQYFKFVEKRKEFPFKSIKTLWRKFQKLEDSRELLSEEDEWKRQTIRDVIQIHKALLRDYETIKCARLSEEVQQEKLPVTSEKERASTSSHSYENSDQATDQDIASLSSERQQIREWVKNGKIPAEQVKKYLRASKEWSANKKHFSSKSLTDLSTDLSALEAIPPGEGSGNQQRERMRIRNTIRELLTQYTGLRKDFNKLKELCQSPHRILQETGTARNSYRKPSFSHEIPPK